MVECENLDKCDIRPCMLVEIFASTAVYEETGCWYCQRSELLEICRRRVLAVMSIRRCQYYYAILSEFHLARNEINPGGIWRYRAGEINSILSAACDISISMAE